jgi:hypothetical protein
MKKILYTGSLLVAILLGSLLASQAAGPVPRIAQINNSIVNYVLPDHIETGTPFNICFHTTVNSPDLEYMDRLDVNLPDSWTVNQVYVEPKSSGCSGDTEAGTETGNVIYWQTDQTMPTGCGPWYNGSYEFCANVTVPSCTGEPWFLSWNIIGDGYGSPPHSTSGSLNPIFCETTGLYLSPNALSTVACHTLTETLTLNLDNQTGITDTFNLYYQIPGGLASISGPDAIYLGDGTDQNLVVQMVPSPCLSAGTWITASAQAAGGGHIATSFIYMTTIRGGSCPVCQKAYLPLTLSNY